MSRASKTRPHAGRAPKWPVAAGRWTYSPDGVLCDLPLKRLRISAPTEFMQAVERHCDGKTEWRRVQHDLGQRWPQDEVDACLHTLFDQGVLVEAGQSLAQHARLGWAPQPLAAAIASPNEQHSLRKKSERRLRREVRSSALLRPDQAAVSRVLHRQGSALTFDDRALPLQALVNILWTLYGVLEADEDRVRRTVPSGGGLYGLRWFMALLRPTPPYSTGLYEVRYHVTGEAGGAISFKPVAGSSDDAWNTLLTASALRFAHAAIYPVADLEFVGQKYGNRSLTLALLEAGHALQSAALAATNEQASTIVRDDTVEMEVQALFKLAEALYPFPALLVGASPTAEQERLARQAQERVPVHAVPRHTSRLALPVRAAIAGPISSSNSSDHVLWATGRSENARIAALKAEAEGWERIGWLTVSQDLVRASFDELEWAVDPAELVAYAASQYRRKDFPFTRFSTRDTYAWVPAIDARHGRTALVLSHCVYAFTALQRRDAASLYTNASTSGVAAFTDMNSARTRAVVELVERDAFARLWLGRTPPSRIDEAEVDSSARRRLELLRAAGYQVSLHWLASDHLPVVAVFAQSAASSMTSVTTAAGFGLDEALDSALYETESRVQQRHDRPPRAPMRPSQVRMAGHHGDFFNTAAGFRQADWLLKNHALVSRKDISARRLPANGSRLMEHLLARGQEVMFCDLTPRAAAIDQGRRPLYVARAFVKGLLPIWFGHGLEPLGLPSATKTPGSRHAIHPCT